MKVKAAALTLFVAAGLIAAPAPASAFTAGQATDAFDAFVDTYWDPVKQYFYTYSDHVIHPEHAVGPEGGLYTDYWWEAQLWEMVMDRYERTGDATSRAMIDDVYDGFVAAYPDFSENDWNDDIGWWARGSIRAYELTGDARYLAAAEEMFAFIAQYEDTTYGGGIWWKNVDVGNGNLNEKNIATNATAVYTALRLYAATGEVAYRQTAERIFAWLEANADNNGHLRDHVSGTGQWVDWDWTYNQGNYAGAALEMYLVSNDPAYLTLATDAVDWAIDNLTSSGTFLFEGANDTAGFKAMLTRNMRALIDEGGQTQYEQVLTDNASQAANHANGSGIVGYDWTAQTAELAVTPLQSLGAGAAVAVLQQAAPDGFTGIVEGSGVYEAENAVRTSVNSEASNPGYSGRGYVAGWIAANSSVLFHVNVDAAGAHQLTFHFAAGAGAATRELLVNGASVGTLGFSGTSGWGDWQNLTATVSLLHGHNTIEVRLGPSNANFVNLDRMTVAL